MRLTDDSSRVAVSDPRTIFENLMDSRVPWESFLPILDSLDERDEAEEPVWFIFLRIADLYVFIRYSVQLILPRDEEIHFREACNNAFIYYNKAVELAHSLRSKHSYVEAVTVLLKAYQSLVKNICDQIILLMKRPTPPSLTLPLRSFYRLISDSAKFSDKALIDRLHNTF
jgi:hypothetical protein